jgi:hypothetical protein
MPDEWKPFVCEVCGETVLTNTSDEEAVAEFIANFGPTNEELSVLCDDCYEKIHGWWLANQRN